MPIRIPILALAGAVGLAAQPLEDQVKRTLDLIAAHRAAVPRLAPIADASARVLLQGGNFHLCCGDNPWIREGDGRAGGPIGLKLARDASTIAAHSVVWVGYSASTFPEARSEIERIPPGSLVVMFGPKPEGGLPQSVLWLDSLTGWDATVEDTLMGNVLSLWSLTGEVAAATANSGKTMAFFQSVWLPGANERNQRFAGLTFHTRLPRMQPVEAGVLAGNYLDAVQATAAGIAEAELPQLRAVGRTIAARMAAGQPVSLVTASHLMSSVAAGRIPVFRFERDSAQFASRVTKRDYVVSLGYSAVDAELFKAVHRAGAGAVWALASSVKPEGPRAEGDTFLDEHWEPGDAAVTAWGYDVPILPPSGIAQLFLYELLLRAANR